MTTREDEFWLDDIPPADDADAVNEFLVEGEIPVVPPAARRPVTSASRTEEDALLEQAGFQIVDLSAAFQDEFLPERELQRRVQMRRFADRGRVAGLAVAAVVTAAFAVSLLVGSGEPGAGAASTTADAVGGPGAALPVPASLQQSGVAENASADSDDVAGATSRRSPDGAADLSASPAVIASSTAAPSGGFGPAAATRSPDVAPNAQAPSRDIARNAAVPSRGISSGTGMRSAGTVPNAPAPARDTARNAPAPSRNGAPNVPAPSSAAGGPATARGRASARPDGSSPGLAPDAVRGDNAAVASNRVERDAAPPTPTAIVTTQPADREEAVVASAVPSAPPPAVSPPPALTANADDGSAAAGRSTPARAETAAATDSTVPWRDLLAGYQTAYERLDARLAKQVWPAVDEGALARAFNALEAQTVTFERCNASLGADRGIASCSGSATYVTGMGHRTSFTERRQWTFLFEKADERWVIGAVETR